MVVVGAEDDELVGEVALAGEDGADVVREDGLTVDSAVDECVDALERDDRGAFVGGLDEFGE